jgi:hypothetical protein
MKTTDVYKDNNLRDAFEAGRQYGIDCGYIQGSLPKPSFDQWIPLYRKTHAVEVTDDELARMRQTCRWKRVDGRKPATIAAVVDAVGRLTGIPTETLYRSDHKQGYLISARSLIYYLCYFHVAVPLTEIAETVGGKHHGTIYTAAKKFEHLITYDKYARNHLALTYSILEEAGYHTELYLYEPELTPRRALEGKMLYTLRLKDSA